MEPMDRLKMRRISFGIGDRRGATLILLGICLGAACMAAEIPDVRLQDTSGATRSLSSYTGKVLVLVFWSFKCPVSLAYIDRVQALQDKYAGRGAVVFGVASNENETADEIRANLSHLNISVPMLLDAEGALAQELGATHTPEVFVLDAAGVLRYRGPLDNNKRAGERGRIAYVENALDALLSGRTVAPSEVRPFGCPIRRKE